MSKGYNPRIASNPYIVGSFACIGGGLFGLDISSMSGVLSNPAYLSTFHNPSSNPQGAIVASMPAGSFVGALMVTQLADKIGRKRTVQLSGLIWVIGSILQCASINRGMLVSEITAPHIRGRLVSLQQWSITWGILIQYFIQFGCSYINGTASFRIPWGLQMIPAIILSLGMEFFPETPRWLFDHKREAEALEVLADLHGGGDKTAELVLLEYEEIKAQVLFERTEGRQVVHGPSETRYPPAASSLDGAGLTGRRGNLIASSVQYVLNVVATIPAIIYIDKWGRRPMLLAGTLAMAFWLFLVGGLQGHFGHWGDVDGSRVWVITDNDRATKAIIVSSYLFVCSFAVTMGPVSWTYPAELFPTKVRGKGSFNWAFNFALAWAVPPGLSNIAYKTYFIFGTFNLAAFLHVFFMYPETVGRTLEESGRKLSERYNSKTKGLEAEAKGSTEKTESA
ncbi:major facilitator superfamily domain-containing protein [Mycena rebaudengoi]|nr:major facilitator superfamily domain-containing protein [Mycena rebaudengoi]